MIVKVKLFLETSFPECQDNLCPHRKECANHCTAGDFRVEGGSTPDLNQMPDGSWECSQKPVARGDGALLHQGPDSKSDKQKLLDALQDLFDSEDDEGCQDDLTVVSKSAVQKLKDLYPINSWVDEDETNY